MTSPRTCWRRCARALADWAVVAAVATAAVGCSPAPKTERAAEIFGTRVTVIIAGLPEAEAAEAAGEVLTHFEDMHRRFHAWRTGELQTLNLAIASGNLPLSVSKPMAEMISLAAEAQEKSGGLFNPAAGALFGLWGFHADEPPEKPPAKEDIQTLLVSGPGMDKISLRGRIVVDAPLAAQIDFGGIAKGAALDAARDILRRRNIGGALINVGGNIMALGTSNGRPWRVSLRAAGQVIELRDGHAVATSGDSERFFIHGGQRYHHIIDPRTGFPATEARAAVAISGDFRHAGAFSDAAATALVIANEIEARRIARKFNLSAAWRASPGTEQAERIMQKQ